MKFAVDRIEDNIVVLENIETKEKKEENIKSLPQNIKEGSILIYDNNLYKKDINLERERRKELKDRFNRLKKK